MQARLNFGHISKERKHIILISFIGTTGLGFAAIVPILVGGIIDTYGFPRSMVGWITSANIFGCAIGGLIATLRIGKTSLTQIIKIGLIGLIAFDLLSIYCTSIESMLSVRLLSGISGGLVYASALAAFSGLKNPIKAFATYVIVYCAYSGIILIAQPFLISTFGVKAGFITLAIVAIISLFFLSSIDKIAVKIKEKEFISLRFLLKNKKVLFGLLSYFSVQLAGGTTWAYCERIGREAGLSINYIGFVLGIGVVFAFLGGLLVMKVGKEKGMLAPLLLGIFVMSLGTIGLFWPHYSILFLFTSCLWGFAWSFVIPYYQQIQANIDTAGRVVSLGTILNMSGRATGPAIAAMLLGDGAYVNVLWISIAALIISALLLFPALSKSTILKTET